MISGTRTVDVNAPAERVFEVLADAEGFPSWQATVKEVRVLERDAQGRPALSETKNDAKVKTVGVQLAYEYEDGRRVAFRSVKGDVKSMRGSFTIEPVDEASCRVTYDMEVDPGRTLGFLLRGPVVDQVTNRVLDGTLSDLQRHVGA